MIDTEKLFKIDDIIATIENMLNEIRRKITEYNENNMTMTIEFYLLCHKREFLLNQLASYNRQREGILYNEKN